MSSPEDVQPAPKPLVVAAVILALQGLLTIALGVAEAFNSHSDRLALGVSTALFFVAYGAALVAWAWGLRHARTWSRGPTLLAELIFLGLAWNFRSGDYVWLAVAVALSAIAVLGCVLHPRSVEALGDH